MDDKKKQELEELKKHFDSIFGTNVLNNINFNNLPLLNKLFEYFEEDLYTTSPKYNELRKKHLEVAELLEKSFTEAQQTLFEKYWEIESQMNLEEHEQLFYFGFMISRTLEQETKLNKQNSN